jgi:hypothetical protein
MHLRIVRVTTLDHSQCYYLVLISQQEKKCKPFPLLLIFSRSTASTIMRLAFHNFEVNVICEAQEGKRERGGGERERGREGGRETWKRDRQTERDRGRGREGHCLLVPSAQHWKCDVDAGPSLAGHHPGQSPCQQSLSKIILDESLS